MWIVIALCVMACGILLFIRGYQQEQAYEAQLRKTVGRIPTEATLVKINKNTIVTKKGLLGRSREYEQVVTEIWEYSTPVASGSRIHILKRQVDGYVNGFGLYVGQHQVGDTIQVFYQPEHPERAIFCPEALSGFLFLKGLGAVVATGGMAAALLLRFW